jgi:hypothetical protein
MDGEPRITASADGGTRSAAAARLVIQTVESLTALRDAEGSKVKDAPT